MKGTFRVLLTVLALAALLCGSAMATNVTFQVNMKAQMALGNFVIATDSVFVRGSFQGWAGYGNRLLDANNDSIYTGTWDIPAGDILFKYVRVHNGTDSWEADPNRTATVGADPLEIPVDWFDRQPPAPPENVEINFRVVMTVQTLSHGWNPDRDLVVVRGNADSLGNWGGAIALTEETGHPGIYSRWIKIPNAAVGVAIPYKFVILSGGIVDSAHWETMNDNRVITPTGNEPDVLPPPAGNGFHEIQPDSVYFSNVGPNDIITNDLNVVFQVDIRPLLGALRDIGYVTDVQTHTDTVREVTNIDIAGYFNTWPWGNFSADHLANDLGQNGDLVAGDGIWSRSIFFAAGSPRVLIYKYGVNMFDAEGSFAHNHEQTLDDTQPTMRLMADCWGAQDTIYNQWQSSCTVSADDHPIAAVSEYRLDQNFPNPFNPVTYIRFSMPREEMATIRVYDLMGRRVTTLINGKVAAGEHTVALDASNFATGVYFYRLEAGSFNTTRKLLLLK
jgi:hypothetical protein